MSYTLTRTGKIIKVNDPNETSNSQYIDVYNSLKNSVGIWNTVQEVKEYIKILSVANHKMYTSRKKASKFFKTKA